MKKVIYIEIDDEVTGIYDQIKRVRQKDIYIVVPRKAILFQSVINLRILKSKADEAKKNLHIVTTDRIGKHLTQQVGLPVYDNIKIEERKVSDKKMAEAKIEPIQARRNEILKDKPQRVGKQKATIGELIREYRSHYKRSKKPATEIAGVYNYVRPKRKFLIFIMLASLGLFFLITYIALPGATIYVEPRFDTIEHSVNIVLADKAKNQTLLSQNEPNVVPSEEITVVTKQTKFFDTAGKQFDGVNAEGFITVINASPDEWPLIQETRFQTEDGLVFRIKEAVFVPPQTTNAEGEDVPGTLEVRVVADPFDVFLTPIGERGNIGPTRFFIPALSEYNQGRIWGESTGDMGGGVTSYQNVVLDSDITSAQAQIEENLILMAKENLNEKIEEMNELNKTSLVLLESDDYLKIELQELRIPDDLEGSVQEQFEVFAQIEARGIAYDADQLYTVLENNLRTRTHPDMQIRDGSIKPDSIVFEAVDSEGYDEEIGQIKITASIKGVQEFVIDSSLQAGVRFSNKVKEKIAGLSTEEAEAYVSNLPEVENVEIKMWPIWLSSIPRITDNIEVKLLES